MSREKYTYLDLPKLNPYIKNDTDGDILYHVILGTKSHDLPKMFRDIKFIVLGGTPKRMEQFAYFLLTEIGYELPPGTILNDISSRSHRYAMFKVGPVLSISHGTGTPSIGIVLNELIKMVYHAQIEDPIFIKIGSCGGFGPPEGTIIITNKVFNEYVDQSYEMFILGNKMKFSTDVDQNLVNELEGFAHDFHFNVKTGATYCSSDFYEGSGRSDGCICKYTQEERIRFFESLQKLGIVNTEMESTAFTALTRRAGIKSAIVTVVTDDNMQENSHVPQSTFNEEKKLELFKFVSTFIRNRLNLNESPEKMRNVSATTVSGVTQDSLEFARPLIKSSTRFQVPVSHCQYGRPSYANFVWSDSDKWTSSPNSEFYNWYEDPTVDEINPSSLANQYDSLLNNTKNKFCSKCGVRPTRKLTESSNKPLKSSNSVCSRPSCSTILAFEGQSFDTPDRGSSLFLPARSSNFGSIKPLVENPGGGADENYVATTHPMPSPREVCTDFDLMLSNNDSTIRNDAMSKSLSSNIVPAAQQEQNHRDCPEFCHAFADGVTQKKLLSTTANGGENRTDGNSGSSVEPSQFGSCRRQYIDLSLVKDESQNQTDEIDVSPSSSISKESIIEKLRQDEFNANRSCNEERRCDAASEIFRKQEYLRATLEAARQRDKETMVEKETKTLKDDNDEPAVPRTPSVEQTSECWKELGATHAKCGGLCSRDKPASILYWISPCSKNEFDSQKYVSTIKSPSFASFVPTRNTPNTKDTTIVTSEAELEDKFKTRRASDQESDSTKIELRNFNSLRQYATEQTIISTETYEEELQMSEQNKMTTVSAPIRAQQDHRTPKKSTSSNILDEPNESKSLLDPTIDSNPTCSIFTKSKENEDIIIDEWLQHEVVAKTKSLDSSPESSNGSSPPLYCEYHANLIQKAIKFIGRKDSLSSGTTVISSGSSENGTSESADSEYSPRQQNEELSDNAFTNSPLEKTENWR